MQKRSSIESKYHFRDLKAGLQRRIHVSQNNVDGQDVYSPALTGNGDKPIRMSAVEVAVWQHQLCYMADHLEEIDAKPVRGG